MPLHLPRAPRHLPRFDRLALAALVLTVLAHVAFTLLPHRSDALRAWGGNLFFFPVFALSAALALRAAARDRARRASWMWFGLGQLGWLIGQGIYSSLQLLEHVQPYPSLADAFYLTLIPCFIAGLLLLNRAPIPRAQRPILTLDTLIIVCALAGAYWTVAIAQSVQDNHGSRFALAVGLAYPLADLLMIALLVVLCVWRPAQFAAPNTLALTGGLVFFLLADVLYQISTTAGTYAIAHPMDTLWTIGAALFGAATALRGAQPAPDPTRPAPLVRAWLRCAEASQLALPYAALLMMLVLALTHYRDTSSVGQGITLVTFLVVALSSGRQLLTQHAARRLQRHLDVQAKHDPLTGLVNRAHLMQRLQGAITHAAHSAQLVAVLFVDLDRFKSVNDTYGHAAGDALLRDVAARLQDAVRDRDIVARQGGDEFVVVLTGIEASEVTDRVAQRLLRDLSAPFTVSGDSVSISASIGITLCPTEASTASDALKNADAAMYEAKRRGRNTAQFYDPATQRRATEAHRIALHLSGAIERGELSVQYQPLVTLTTGRPHAAEALLRWHSPVLGAVSPAVFIPIAEQRGLIAGIGSWVLERAARQVSEWRAAGHPDFAVTVNVSPVQFEQDGFVEEVRGVLARCGLPGSALTLELTEGALLKDIEASKDKLGQVRALGVRVALDDFGTGYSSLAYLRQLPVDIVKIDRSFVWAMEQEGPTFVEAIVRIAHHLGLRTVAEGVETEAQRAHLLDLACPSGQGYLFSAPVRPEVLLALLHQGGQEGRDEPPMRGAHPRARDA